MLSCYGCGCKLRGTPRRVLLRLLSKDSPYLKYNSNLAQVCSAVTGEPLKPSSSDEPWVVLLPSVFPHLELESGAAVVELCDACKKSLEAARVSSDAFYPDVCQILLTRKLACSVMQQTPIVNKWYHGVTSGGSKAGRQQHEQQRQLNTPYVVVVDHLLKPAHARFRQPLRLDLPGDIMFVMWNQQASAWHVLAIVLYNALPVDAMDAALQLASFKLRAVKRSQRVEFDGSGPIFQLGWRYALNPTCTMCRAEDSNLGADDAAKARTAVDRAGLGMYQVMKDRLNCEDLLEGVADSVSIAPGLPFTSMGFTINYAAQPHCDTGDVGPSIIAWVEPGDAAPAGVFNLNGLGWHLPQLDNTVLVLRTAEVAHSSTSTHCQCSLCSEHVGGAGSSHGSAARYGMVLYTKAALLTHGRNMREGIASICLQLQELLRLKVEGFAGAKQLAGGMLLRQPQSQADMSQQLTSLLELQPGAVHVIIEALKQECAKAKQVKEAAGGRSGSRRQGKQQQNGVLHGVVAGSGPSTGKSAAKRSKPSTSSDD